MKLRCFSGCLLVSTPPSLLLTKKAVVSSKDGDVSVFIYFVHFVLCDVTLQFYLPLCHPGADSVPSPCSLS